MNWRKLKVWQETHSLVLKIYKKTIIMNWNKDMRLQVRC